jgi:hypothetical protein
MRTTCIILLLSLAGCVAMKPPPPEKKMTAEETLGMYFLMSALSSKDGMQDFLQTVYPLRAQLVTFAIVGYHRDRKTWPTSKEDLVEYVSSSPANPGLPEDALAGLELEQKADGSIAYSTLEDRQRGREFTISTDYAVTFPVPSYPFASATSAEVPPGSNATLRYDWSDALIDALVHAASARK